MRFFSSQPSPEDRDETHNRLDKNHDRDCLQIDRAQFEIDKVRKVHVPGALTCKNRDQTVVLAATS